MSRRNQRKPKSRLPRSLATRVVTALLLLPVVVWILFYADDPILYGLLCTVNFGLLYEWAGLARLRSELDKISYAVLGTGIAIILPFLGDQVIYWSVVCAAAVIVPATACVVFFGPLKSILANPWIVGLFGWIVCVGAVVSCGYFEGDRFALASLFAIVWLVDTGAYLTGNLLGKHTLHKAISPNKTWEGVIGGMAFGVAVAAFVVHVLDWIPLTNPTIWIALAALAILGDLFESALKRVAQVKDSSNLIPGHGGLLDRLDSALLAAPAMHLLLL